MEELRQELNEFGIEPAKYGIDLEDASNDELRKLIDLTIDEQIERARRNSEGYIHSDEISFYNPDRHLENDPVYARDFERIVEGLVEQDFGDNIETLTEPYVIEEDSLLEVYDSVVEDFLEFADSEISEKRRGKLELANYVAKKPERINSEEAIKWFEERDSVDFDRIGERMLSGINLDLGRNEKILEQTLDGWRDIKGRSISSERKVYTGLLVDLAVTLEGLALSNDDQERYSEKVREYRNFLEKFRPEEYNDIEGSTYKTWNVFGAQKINQLGVELETCIYRPTVSPDAETNLDYNAISELPEMYHRDPFTFIQAIGKDGDLEGYSRSFLMEDSNGRDFLAIDTLEIPEKTGADMEEIKKNFSNRSDLVQAGAISAIKLGKDLGVDYIAGKEGRMSWGPRQGYSNTSKDVEYRKYGEPVPYYSVAKKELRGSIPLEGKGFRQMNDEEIVEDAYRNMKVLPDGTEKKDLEVDRSGKQFEAMLKYDIPRERSDEKAPGFSFFSIPREEDIRGFNTMPGWHETEAKILAEFPGHRNIG